LNQGGIATTFFTPVGSLAVGTVHYWRVTAVNAGGNTVMSGSPGSFRTLDGPGLVAGGCGLTGLEGLALLLVLVGRRRR
jgi:hypothetical protein